MMSRTDQIVVRQVVGQRFFRAIGRIDQIAFGLKIEAEGVA